MQPARRRAAATMESRVGLNMVAGIAVGRSGTGVAKRRWNPFRVSAARLVHEEATATAAGMLSSQRKARRHQPAVGDGCLRCRRRWERRQQREAAAAEPYKGFNAAGRVLDIGRPCHRWRVMTSSSSGVKEAEATDSDASASLSQREQPQLFAQARERA